MTKTYTTPAGGGTTKPSNVSTVSAPPTWNRRTARHAMKIFAAFLTPTTWNSGQGTCIAPSVPKQTSQSSSVSSRSQHDSIQNLL